MQASRDPSGDVYPVHVGRALYASDSEGVKREDLPFPLRNSGESNTLM